MGLNIIAFVACTVMAAWSISLGHYETGMFQLLCAAANALVIIWRM